MAKKAILQPKKIHIAKFKLVKGLIDSPLEFDQSKITSHSFQIDFDLEFSLEDKLVKADFNVEIITESKEEEQEEAKGIFHFVFIYNVENLNELITVLSKEEEITIDANLGNALASISYSTSRGILMTRFQGTALEDFILPVIDPNDLLE